MNESGAPSGEDLVREILAEVAPRELAAIGPVLDAYRRRPWPPVPPPDRRGHPTGAGVPVDQLASWGEFVAGFVGNVLATMVAEEGFKEAGRGLLARWRRRRPRLTDRLPRPLDDGQRGQVRAAALEAARDRGFPESSAEQFAEAVDRILRRPRS